MNDYVGIVEQNQEIGPKVFLMTVTGEVPQFQPGQFCLLSSGLGDRILPRPLGVSRSEDNQLELIYRLVGLGTAKFAALRKGDQVRLRGPAGNRFPLPVQPTVGFAGTLGIVPLLLWRDRYGPFQRLHLGVPNGQWRDFAHWVQQRVPETEVYCDDGSFGIKGSCLNGLATCDHDVELVACGPNGMLKALAQQKQNRKCYVSLERRMGCGFGGCHGCVVTVNSSSKRLCVDGPVLNAEEVDWNGLCL